VRIVGVIQVIEDHLAASASYTSEYDEEERPVADSGPGWHPRSSRAFFQVLYSQHDLSRNLLLTSIAPQLVRPEQPSLRQNGSCGQANDTQRGKKQQT
jgi:hypothetical protein